MSRPCLVCTNGLAMYVRGYLQEGRRPGYIRKRIFEKYGLDINERSMARHIKFHDPESGTYTIQKNQARQVLVKAQVKNELAGENLAQARQMLQDLSSFFSRVVGMHGHIDATAFSEMSPKDQASVINQTISSMAKLKKLEIDQERLDKESNPILENVWKLASRAGATPEQKRKMRKQK